MLVQAIYMPQSKIFFLEMLPAYTWRGTIMLKTQNLWYKKATVNVNYYALIRVYRS